MASRELKTLPRTSEIGSEELFDFHCSRCERKQKTSEASHYCQTCDSYFCANCLALHDEFMRSGDHIVFDSSNLAARGRRNEYDCPKHEGNKLTMFCKIHGHLCCHICVAVDHRSCHAMTFIPDAAKGILHSRELRSMKNDIQSLKSKIGQLKLDKEDMRRSSENSCKEFQNTVSNLRKRIRKTLDRLQQKANDEMERIYSECDRAISRDIDLCESLLENLESEQNHLDDLGEISDNESLIFIRIKSLQNKITNYMKRHEDLSRQNVNGTFTFIVDRDLNNFIENIQTIGSFDLSQDETVQGVRTEGNVKRKSGILKKQVTPRPAEATPKPKNKETLKKQYSVRSKEDENECCIQGLCQLPDGDILMSDFSNLALKQLDRTYTIVGRCQLPSEPNGLCYMKGDKVAVALDNRTIQYVSVKDNKLKKLGSIKLKHDCYGLSYHANKLYVTECGGSKLYIHDTSGTLIQTIDTDKAGNSLFTGTYHICVSVEGEDMCIYVVDRDKGLVVVDKQGHCISEVNCQDVSDPRSVCTDGAGHVYICGNLSHNVVRIGERGERLTKIVVSQADGIRGPESIFFDRMRASLIVSSTESGQCDVIYVFTMHQKTSP